MRVVQKPAYADKYSIKNNLHHFKNVEHDYSSFHITTNLPVAILVLCKTTRCQKPALVMCFGKKQNVILVRCNMVLFSSIFKHTFTKLRRFNKQQKH